MQLWQAGVIAATATFVISLSMFKFQSVSSFIDPNVAMTTTVEFCFEPIHLLSPDRSYEIKNEFLADNLTARPCADDPRCLFLSRVGNPTKIALCDISRSVEVSWSPDSKWFAVNDWYGSNISESYIYRLSDAIMRSAGKLKRFSLRDSLMASDVPSDVKDIVAISDHNYISVEHWYGNRLLLVKASGHFNPSNQSVKEYTFVFSFDMESNKWKLLKRMDFES